MEKTKLKSLLVFDDINIKQAMQKLNETGERILFVIGLNNVLLGTVTDGDIRRGIISGAQLTGSIAGLMNKKFITINANVFDIQKEARELMQRFHIGHIPVVSGQGTIEDVVAWTDCLALKSTHRENTSDMSQHPVVIMAGGRGTRLDPFTKILPKPLIPFHDKPIIEHIMDHFYKNGFSKFILILNYKKEMIKMYLSENAWPFTIDFVEENDYYGTAGGLFLLKNRLDRTFVVTNCDTMLEGDYLDFFKWHQERKNLLTIVGSHREITVPYGVLSMNNGFLSDIDEKPKIDLFVNTGTYVIEPVLLDFIPENQALDMDKLISTVRSKHENKIGVYPHWGGWCDIGQWDEYRRSLKKIGEQIDEL